MMVRRYTTTAGYLDSACLSLINDIIIIIMVVGTLIDPPPIILNQLSFLAENYSTGGERLRSTFPNETLTSVTTVPSLSFSFLGTNSYPNQGGTSLHTAQ